MLPLIKVLTSAVIIWLVNEVVVRHSKPLLGSLIASLPLVSLITFFWIHHDLRGRPGQEVEKLAAHSTGIFWFVLSSLPMFLLFAFLLKRGVGFWPSLGAGCFTTMILYFIMVQVLNR
jgi:hypothetical protein